MSTATAKFRGDLGEIFTWAAWRYSASLVRTGQIRSAHPEAIPAPWVRAEIAAESHIQMLLRDLGREIVGRPGRYECDCNPFRLEDAGYCICGRSPGVRE